MVNRTVVVGRSTTVAVPASDPDGDTFAVSASSGDTDVLTVSVSGTDLTLTGVERGDTTVTVTATDAHGSSGTRTFSAIVNGRPVVGALSDVVVAPGGSAAVAVTVTEPDGETYRLSASSSDEEVATVSVPTAESGTSVTVAGVAAGTATVTVTADDGSGATNAASWPKTFTVRVNSPPTIARMVNRTVVVGRSTTVAVPASDPDGDTFAVTASSGDTDVLTVSVSGTDLTLTGVERGDTTVTVTATDAHGSSGTRTFSAIVNGRPVVGALSDVVVAPGGSAAVAVTVTEPDGETYRLSASSSDEEVATVSVPTAESGTSVTVAGVAAGTATVTVTADDGSGATNAASWPKTFTVTVRESLFQIGDIASQTVVMPDTATVVVPVTGPGGDPYSGSFTVSAESGDTNVVTVSVDEDTLTITGVAAETSTNNAGNAPRLLKTNVTVTVSASGARATATVPVTVLVSGCGAACPVANGDRVFEVTYNPLASATAQFEAIQGKITAAGKAAEQDNLTGRDCYQVVVPAGTYRIAPADQKRAAGLVMRSRVCLVGKTGTRPQIVAGRPLHVLNLDSVHMAAVGNLDIVGYSSPGTGQCSASNLPSRGYHGIRGGTLATGARANSNVLIDDVSIRCASGYGIGMQRGIVTNSTFSRIAIHQTGADGIDLKNEPDDSTTPPTFDGTSNVLFKDVTVQSFGIAGLYRGEGHREKAGIDLRGSHIVLWQAKVVGVSSGNVGIRLREDSTRVAGEPGFLNGPGAHSACILSSEVSGVSAFATGIVMRPGNSIGGCAGEASVGATVRVSGIVQPAGGCPVGRGIRAERPVPADAGGTVTIGNARLENLDRGVWNRTGVSVCPVVEFANVATERIGPHCEGAANQGSSCTKPVMFAVPGADVSEGEPDASVVYHIHRRGPNTPLTVNLQVTESGQKIADAAQGRQRIAHSKSVVKHTIGVVDDEIPEPPTTVSVAVDAGTGYLRATTAGIAAGVVVHDNERPAVNPIADRSLGVGATRTVPVAVTDADDDGNHTVAAVSDDPGAVRVSASGSTVTLTGVAPGSALVTVTATDGSGAPNATSHATEFCVTAATTSAEVSVTAGAGVSEGNAATYTLSRTGATTCGMTVSVAVTESGAMLQADKPSSVAFERLSATAQLSIPTLDDSTDEAASTVTVTVATGDGYRVAGAAGTATVVVSDDDLSPPAAPASLTAAPGDRRVRLSWSMGSGGGPVETWQYRARRDSAAEAWQPDWTDIAGGAVPREFVITALPNGQAWEFELRAANEDAAGPSRRVAATPVVHPPASLKASAGDGSVALAWTAHTDTADDVVWQHRWAQEVATPGERAWKAWVDVAESADRRAVVTGLAADVEYAFQLRAATSSTPRGEHDVSTSLEVTAHVPPALAFNDGAAAERRVEPGRSAGFLIGTPVGATGAKPLAWAIKDPEGIFGIDPATGQLRMAVDGEDVFELLQNGWFRRRGRPGVEYLSIVFRVTVTVTDALDRKARTGVAIRVTSDTEGEVWLSTYEGKIDKEISASVSDPDGPLPETVVWQWEYDDGYWVDDGSGWFVPVWRQITGATTSKLSPTADMAGWELRAVARYADGLSAQGARDKRAASAPTDEVQLPNASAHGLELLQGPLAVHFRADGTAIQQVALVASRLTMAVVEIRHDSVGTQPSVLLNVATATTAEDVEAVLHSTTAVTARAAASRDVRGGVRSSVYLAMVAAEQVQPDATFTVVVDPTDAVAEADETDNELVASLSGLRVVEPPVFKVTAVPLGQRRDVGGAVTGSYERLFSETLALLPIGDHRIGVAPALPAAGTSPRHMLDRLHAAWNRAADPDEFYHGLYDGPPQAYDGLALVGGRVAVSRVPESAEPAESAWIVAHGMARNFGLSDTAHSFAATRGWSSASTRFYELIPHEVMLPMRGPTLFISHVNYERAMSWMHATAALAEESGPGAEPATVRALGSLAFTGGVDESGAWYLHSVEESPKAPRPASSGPFTVALYDGTGMRMLEQPLHLLPLSVGQGAAWALRVPTTPRPVRALRIRGEHGLLLLDESIGR